MNNLDYYVQMFDHPFTSIVGIVVINILMLAVAWIKFKTALVTHTTEIKHHSDVAVQKLNGMLTYVINAMDRPAWVKVANMHDGNVEFRMLEMNNDFSQLAEIERIDYLGKTDLEAGVPKPKADKYHAQDLAVWGSGQPQTFTETIHGVTHRFRKMRVVSTDGTTKGVLGYAIDCNAPHDCPFHTLSKEK